MNWTRGELKDNANILLAAGADAAAGLSHAAGRTRRASTSYSRRAECGYGNAGV